MALTKEQIRDRIARRLLAEYVSDVDFADVAAALQGLTAQEKQQIANAVRLGKAQALGAGIIAKVKAHLLTLATTDADGVLNDDALSLAEIERVFL